MNDIFSAKLREALTIKEQSANFEIVDDTAGASVLDAKAEALLGELNEELLNKIAPNDYTNYSPKVKFQLEELGRLYIQLFDQVNQKAEGSFWVRLLRELKKEFPKYVLYGFASSMFTMMVSKSKRNAIYALLGWCLGGVLGKTGISLYQFQDESSGLSADAQETLVQIQAIEKSLAAAGIKISHVNVGLPIINRDRSYV